MPPWAAIPGYGDFANDNSLTLREVQFMVSWVEGLGPRNAGTVFLNVQDPGASALSLEVENLPALLARMKRAGVTVETPGGEPIALGGGARGVLVRSPDGLLIELVEPASSQAAR